MHQLSTLQPHTHPHTHTRVSVAQWECLCTTPPFAPHTVHTRLVIDACATSCVPVCSFHCCLSGHAWVGGCGEFHAYLFVCPYECRSPVVPWFAQLFFTCLAVLAGLESSFFTAAPCLVMKWWKMCVRDGKGDCVCVVCLCVYMSVCVCVCMLVCMNVFRVCMSAYVYLCVYVTKNTNENKCVCVCVFVVFSRVHEYKYEYLCVFVRETRCVFCVHTCV